MYLKEIEYRFDPRKDNLFKLFVRRFFGYGCPHYLKMSYGFLFSSTVGEQFMPANGFSGFTRGEQC
ncbi:MAG: hypothetical protein LZF60_20038 [Nitrospira sp.]|nr:MAG: hypothetical protein LZF60_20038 [Nitrospira sp.]